MKKVEKQNNPNHTNLFWCKSNITRFGFHDLRQDFDIMRIVDTAIDVFQDNRSKKMCIMKYIFVDLAFLI